mmetsp:Transcript_28756/g.66997  ORF Transcript_28756/g.66997 Transcript_28756/m.66997 type:complete len:308 (+) Transcript_28756:84-1007(+)
MADALSRSRILPILAALAAVLALGAGAAWKFFLKQYLERWNELKKRRKARAALVAATGKDKAKVQHMVLYFLAGLADNSDARKRLDSLMDKANKIFPGNTSQFANFGSKSMDKQALLSFLGKPDMSLSMSHCLFMGCEDPAGLKLFLHSSLHKQEWYSTGGPFFKGCIELMTDVGMDLSTEGKEDPILELVFLKFQEHVTDDSDTYGAFLKAVAEFNKCSGISACLRPAGNGLLLKEDLLKEVEWQDSSQGFTHCLTVLAESPQHLKDLMQGEAYGRWMMTEMPHLKQDGVPPAVIFFLPLKVSVKC